MSSYSWTYESFFSWKGICPLCGVAFTIEDSSGQLHVAANRDIEGDRIHGGNCSALRFPTHEPLKNPEENTYQGAIRMWRIWKSHFVLDDQFLLGALTQAHYWGPGENKCLDMSGPYGGFYGFSSYSEFLSQEEDKHRSALAKGPEGGYVIGSILCYGRIKVGTKGARAEFAVPEYLIAPEDADTALKLFEIADFYGCKIISDEQAQELKTGLVPYRKPLSLEDIVQMKEEEE